MGDIEGEEARIRPTEALASVTGVASEVLAMFEPLPPVELPLSEAVGQVLAADVLAPFHLPAFDNSAMDGYALRATDAAGASEATPARLLQVGASLAGGRGPLPPLRPGTACLVATGAPMPADADAVVRVEDTRREGGYVVLRRPVSVGANVRRAGEDVGAGDVVLPAGAVLGPGQVAAAAAVGRHSLSVRRPRVGVIPTGDEVAGPGAPLGVSQVHDAVGPALAAMVSDAGAAAWVGRPVPDAQEALAAALSDAAARSDLVLTVGGVSVGVRDLVQRVVAGLGRAEVRRVALRPAKPLAFGRIGRVPWIGLPGNPAAALAAFEVFVRPAIQVMRGEPARPRRSFRATLAEPIVQRPGRLHLVRARVWRDGERLIAASAGPQGAGRLGSLAAANAWMILAESVERLDAGAEVDVTPMWGEGEAWA